MSSNARQLAANLPREGGLSSRNLIINGACTVAQRGSVISAGSTNTYTLDRWINRSGTILQDTDVPPSQGFKNSMLYENNAARSSINMRQVIEDGFTLMNGRDITVSFWIKTSVTTNIAVDLHDTYSSGYTLSCPANTWTFHSYTFEAVDTSLFTNYWGGPHAHLDFNFGTDYPDVNITGVQLEVGDTATPFEHEPYSVTLQKCQRYFWKRTAGNNQSVGTGTYYQTTGFYVPINFPVEMRTTPTFGYSSGTDYFRIYSANNGGDYFNAFSGVQGSGGQNSCLYIGSLVSGTAGHAGWLELWNAAAFISFDAEL